jgi:DNA polymerase-1
VSRLLIMDGHAYAYRAFHAIRDLRSPSGRPTNAIYGFVKMLEKMRLAIQPTHLMVAWDGGLSAKRVGMLAGYKAQRPDMPEALKPQLDGMVDYLRMAGIASFCREGIEADDYIAWLAKHAAGDGMNVVIASSDKDFMQLVSPQVGILNPNDKSGQVWTAAQVVAKTGVQPIQVVDWLSLMGDTVDNIPGVPGVGPKTATDLLGQFGSVARLFAELGAVKSDRLRTALRDAEGDVRRNLELIRLHDDLPFEFSAVELVVKPADISGLRGLFEQWGFKGLLAALPEPVREQQAVLIE